MKTPIPILEIQTGKFKGHRINISTEEEVVIGRSETARIRIPSLEVSREHCRLVFQNRRLMVEDLKSRNGTFINGRPIAGKRFLAPGSTLTIGPVTFLLLGSGPPPERPSAEVQLSGKSAVDVNYSDDQIVDWISANGETITGIGKLETADEIPLVPPSHFLPRGSRSSIDTGESLP